MFATDQAPSRGLSRRALAETAVPCAPTTRGLATKRPTLPPPSGAGPARCPSDLRVKHGSLPGCESGRQDLNLRPPGPQPGALPDCATPRGARPVQSGRATAGRPPLASGHGSTAPSNRTVIHVPSCSSLMAGRPSASATRSTISALEMCTISHSRLRLGAQALPEPSQLDAAARTRHRRCQTPVPHVKLPIVCLSSCPAGHLRHPTE